MRVEELHRRVLGAIRLVDSTTALPITRPLIVEGTDVGFLRNRSGAYVITRAPGLEVYAQEFMTPPPAPPVASVSVTVTVRDPLGEYLARQQTLRLPRDAAPARAREPESIFSPVILPLYVAPRAQIPSAWAAIRASVRAEESGSPLAGALIRVTASNGAAPIARGISDERGEALVPIAGIPVTTWGESEDTVVVTEVDLSVETVFDPEAGEVPDPDDMDARRDELRSSSVGLRLAAGRVLVTTLSVPMA